MDPMAFLEKFGFTVAAAVFLGWWLKASLTDRIKALEAANAAFISKVDELNRYIREEQAELISEAHLREKELVAIIRNSRPGGGDDGGTPLPHPAPLKNDPNRTETILAAVRDKHRA